MKFNPLNQKLVQLSNQELDHHLAERISKEKEILSEILYLILEVDRRRLYLERAYPSLFEYLVKHHGYSAGSAHRRIEAARLMKDIPDLPARLESGSLNLTQVGLVQKAIKQTIRQNKTQVSKEEKVELIQNLQHKTFAESQTLVAQAFDFEIKAETKTQYQKDESVRVEVTFSKEQWQKVKQMQQLLSHSIPIGNDLVKTLEYLAEKVIKQKTMQKNQSSVSKAKMQNSDTNTPIIKADTRPVQITAKNIKASIRKTILQRDQCCQFKDTLTQKLCGSKVFLQIDHLKPKWAGGNNLVENLQVLCAAHNRFKYQMQTGVRRL